MFHLLYTSIDGAKKHSRTETIKGARAFVTRRLGDTFEIGSSYAISADGVGKVQIVAGTTWRELFADRYAAAGIPKPITMEGWEFLSAEEEAEYEAHVAACPTHNLTRPDRLNCYGMTIQEVARFGARVDAGDELPFYDDVIPVEVVTERRTPEPVEYREGEYTSANENRRTEAEYRAAQAARAKVLEARIAKRSAEIVRLESLIASVDRAADGPNARIAALEEANECDIQELADCHPGTPNECAICRQPIIGAAYMLRSLDRSGSPVHTACVPPLTTEEQAADDVRIERSTDAALDEMVAGFEPMEPTPVQPDRDRVFVQSDEFAPCYACGGRFDRWHAEAKACGHAACFDCACVSFVPLDELTDPRFRSVIVRCHDCRTPVALWRLNWIGDGKRFDLKRNTVEEHGYDADGLINFVRVCVDMHAPPLETVAAEALFGSAFPVPSRAGWSAVNA